MTLELGIEGIFPYGFSFGSKHFKDLKSLTMPSTEIEHYVH